MSSIIVSGGTPLYGKVSVSGCKNAALPIMASTLLSDSEVILSNVPKLIDINTMNTLLQNSGAEIKTFDNVDSLSLSINCRDIKNFTADYELVSKMRASIWVLAPMLARFGKAKVSLPGGCSLGARQVDLHLEVLKSMGATIYLKHGYIYATTNNNKLHGTCFNFDKVSVGATITGILAASIAQGNTILTNCAQEPEIVDLCKCLIKRGCHINGIGTKELEIHSNCELLSGCEYTIMPDRIEAGTYMIAAAITKGELDICGIDHNIIENLSSKLIQAGLKVSYHDDSIKVKYEGVINAVDMQTLPYPGFPTDLQAQFMSLMSISDGVCVITENIFENRLMHVPELNRMGANITVNGNHIAVIRGVNQLSAATVKATDLRASVSLVLAGLVAKGTTEIKNIHHLDRGYQTLEQKLSNCGANIQRL